jgi:hypothetical protein
MSNVPKRIFLALALAAQLFMAGPAAASRAMPIVTGRVSAVYGYDRIDVDGRAYTVRLGSGAYENLNNFSTGQIVDLVLDGPPEAPETRVVEILLHNR